jgi:diguanylate cyclase (GGDEF)-like protein/PAS domain S-box-containing protein
MERLRAEDLVALQVAAIEATANAVVITDIDGKVVWVNPAFERLTGYCFEEIVGESTRMLKSGENPKELYLELWQTILDGKVWRGVLINQRKDRSLYHEEMTIAPLKNDRGTITHFVAVKQDVTERTRIEQRISSLSRVLENTTEYIRIGDATAKITFANRALLRALGYDEQELIGRDFHSILSPVNSPKLVDEIFTKTFSGGWSGECLQRNKDGSDIPVLLSTGILNDRNGGIAGVFGIARDISERKRAEQELLFKNTLLEAQAEATIDGILAVDEDNRIILSNQQFAKIWGVPPEMLQAGDDNRLLEYVVSQIENPVEFLDRVEYLYLHPAERAKDEVRLKDGRVLDRYSSPLLDSAGSCRGRIWYFRDITERIKALERTQLWSRVLEQSTEAIFVCDPQERILVVNKAFERLTGYTAAEAVGKTPRLLQSGQQDRAFYAGMWKSIAESGSWHGEIWNRRKNGEIYPEWLSISAVNDRNGPVSHFVGIFSDSTSRKQDEERIAHLAQYDALTDLPNRVLLMDRLNQLTKASGRSQTKVAVIFIDLDRFKDVNDSLGHDAGDLLLQTAGKRLSHAVREQDTVARIGGDEFVVVLQGVRSPDDVASFAQKLLSCLTEPINLNGYELTVTASMGISVCPDDAKNGQDMIRNADAAMYQAKGTGRNAYHFYTADLNERALEMLSMENALRRAIERDEFVLYYQPQIDTYSGAVVGAEALIRWNHPELGPISPARFIPIAEERGLIIQIGNWVIEEAARQAAAWRAAKVPAVRIAVNVSAVQFRQKDFVEQVTNAVRKHGIPPSALELELTESIVMRDADAAIEILGKLHDLGFHLSIDDFGTGYSSLSRLRRFPIDKIKIDQSFVADENGMGIVNAVIGIARSLNLKVIAEGVETDEQLRALRELHCDQAQGFLISKPVPAREFAQFLTTWQPSRV